MPQLPQFVGSMVVSVQSPPQKVSPVRHAQVPPLHVWFDGQAVPQAPQFPESFSGFTQLPLHGTNPAAQTHAPL
jgi:hypothetical protein